MTREKSAGRPAALRIRAAVPTDAPVIVAFNRALARETEDRELPLEVVTRGVHALLDDPGKGLYFVAESGGRVVGQIMVTSEWSDWRDGLFWWIQSVYVHAEHRRGGVFRALFDHVYSYARREAKVCGLRLYVERDNAGAQRTYSALGAKASGYRVMEWSFKNYRKQ